MSRITEVDTTEELMLIKAPSRNRAVYRLRGPFLGTFFVLIPIHREASKKVQNIILKEFHENSDISIAHHV